MFIKKFLLLICVFALSGYFLSVEKIFAQESGVQIFPHIIDEKAKANDIIKYDIKLTNNTGRKVGLYPVVNDITSDGGLQEFTSPNKLDKQASLARWISISRGVVNIEPGRRVCDSLGDQS
jgi:hypothetical protein